MMSCGEKAIRFPTKRRIMPCLLAFVATMSITPLELGNISRVALSFTISSAPINSSAFHTHWQAMTADRQACIRYGN